MLVCSDLLRALAWTSSWRSFCISRLYWGWWYYVTQVRVQCGGRTGENGAGGLPHVTPPTLFRTSTIMVEESSEISFTSANDVIDLARLANLRVHIDSSKQTRAGESWWRQFIASLAVILRTHPGSLSRSLRRERWLQAKAGAVA